MEYIKQINVTRRGILDSFSMPESLSMEKLFRISRPAFPKHGVSKENVSTYLF